MTIAENNDLESLFKEAVEEVKKWFIEIKENSIGLAKKHFPSFWR